MQQETAHTSNPSQVHTAQELTALLVRVRLEKCKHSFAILFEHFAPRVKSYALKLGSDDVMAEEIAQQTMLQVWRKADLFNESKALASTWIFRIARNLRLDMLRKSKNFNYDDHDLTQIEDESENQENCIQRMEEAEIVKNAISTLPPQQIEIIHLAYYEGLSHSEIANELDLPLGTVKSRVRLAMSRIRQQLEELR